MNRLSKMTGALIRFLPGLFVASPGFATAMYVDQTRIVACETEVTPADGSPIYKISDSGSATGFDQNGETLAAVCDGLSRASNLATTSPWEIWTGSSLQARARSVDFSEIAPDGLTSTASVVYELIFSLDVSTEYNLAARIAPDFEEGVDLELEWWLGPSSEPNNPILSGVCSSDLIGQPEQACTTPSSVWDRYSGTLAPGVYRLSTSSLVDVIVPPDGYAISLPQNSISLTFVPEPSAALLVGFGLVGLAARRRTRLIR